MDESTNYRNNSAAGTAAYKAPEMKKSEKGFTKSVDVWAFGCVLFEMMYAQQPFSATRIAAKDFKLHVDHNRAHSPVLVGLLRSLLEIKPAQRLGCDEKYAKGNGGWAEIKAHPFFAAVDFDALSRREIEPPSLPDLTCANCDGDSALIDQLVSSSSKVLTAEEQALFDGWEYKTTKGGTESSKAVKRFRGSISHSVVSGMLAH